MNATHLDLNVSDLNMSDPERNRVQAEDAYVHDWYRFVLSYPPHLVRHYLQRFGQDEKSVVLDPFVGTGTTAVEAKKNGIAAIGMEPNPVVHLAAKVKTDWTVDPSSLVAVSDRIANALSSSIGGVMDAQEVAKLDDTDLLHLDPAAQKLLLKGSISPMPLHKALSILNEIDQCDEHVASYLRVAMASTLVKDAGNLRFGPEVGVTKPKVDVDVLKRWKTRVDQMAADLNRVIDLASVSTTIMREDSRLAVAELPEQSISAVITSPPYPNEKDYTRTTRLEDVVLGYVKDRSELQQVKKQLVRSNTRGVYKADTDDKLAEQYPEVCEIAEEIERRRIELGKTSGFERLYARVTKLYFGGMARHLSELRNSLKPGAQLAYVVGDQASYLRVLIRTAPILGHIAESLGYEVESIDLFRTRAATATKAQLREEVLVLRWH